MGSDFFNRLFLFSAFTVALLFFTSNSFASVSPGTWWNTNYNYRQNVAIQNTSMTNWATTDNGADANADSCYNGSLPKCSSFLSTNVVSGYDFFGDYVSAKFLKGSRNKALDWITNDSTDVNVLVDLGQLRSVDELRFNLGYYSATSGNRVPLNFAFTYSDDNVTWNTALSGLLPGQGSAGQFYKPFSKKFSSPTNVRYIKFNCITGSASGCGVSDIEALQYASLAVGYVADYEMNLNDLITTGKLREDLNDLRVVYWNGSSWTEIDHDVESKWTNDMNSNGSLNLTNWQLSQYAGSGGTYSFSDQLSYSYEDGNIAITNSASGDRFGILSRTLNDVNYGQIETRIIDVGAGETACLMLKFDDFNAIYAAVDDNAIEFCYNNGASGKTVNKRVMGTETQLYSSGVESSTNGYLTILKQGSEFRFYFNAQEFYRTTISDFQADINTLKIFLYNKGAGTVRFYNDLEAVKIPYKTATNAKIKFKVQSQINASSTDSGYYIYYGTGNNYAVGAPSENLSNVYNWVYDYETDAVGSCPLDTAACETGVSDPFYVFHKGRSKLFVGVTYDNIGSTQTSVLSGFNAQFFDCWVRGLLSDNDMLGCRRWASSKGSKSLSTDVNFSWDEQMHVTTTSTGFSSYIGSYSGADNNTQIFVDYVTARPAVYPDFFLSIPAGAEEQYQQPIYSVQTFLNGRATSFFGQGQTVKIVAKGAFGYAPSITITDSNGVIQVAGGGAMTESAEDYNAFYYNFDVNGSTGWFDVNISSGIFENVFYKGEVWQNLYTDSDSRIFPFRFDFNISVPNDVNRWFDVVDRRIDLNYGASAAAIRVLDFNGTNYLEIPSQIYDLNYSGNYVYDANLVFLATAEKGKDHNYVVAYARVDLNKSYGFDLNSQDDVNSFYFENSLLKVRLDLNQGGVVRNAWQKQVLLESKDLAGYNPMVLSPEAKIGPVTNSAYSMTNPAHSFDMNGSLVSRYSIAGTVGNMDYNMLYTFFAKNPFFLVDINTKPRTNDNWDYYADNYLFLYKSDFNQFSYFDTNLQSVFITKNAAGSGASNIGDQNYIAAFDYNNLAGLGAIFLSKQSTQSMSPNVSFSDSVSYENWTRKLWSASKAVSTSDLFQSRQAIVLFNAGRGIYDLNAIWLALRNPVSFVVSGSSTSDSTNPYFSQTFYSPRNPTDNNQIRCFADVNDNIEIDRVDLNVSGPDLNVQTSFSVLDLNSSLYYDFNTNAGTFDCNWTVYDMVGNKDSNAVRFNIADNNAPKIRNVYNTPDTNALLDHSTNIRVDVNLTEYSGFGDVNLLLHFMNSNGSWSDWNYWAMGCSTVSDYNRDCNVSFTSRSVDTNYEYKVRAMDVNGFDVNSVTKTLASFSDYTWISNRQSFGTLTSSGLDSNVNLGLLDINNNSDNSLSFVLTSNWDDLGKVYYNGVPETASGYSFSLASNTGVTLDVNVTSKSSERNDDLNVVVNPTTANAVPDLNNVSATIISSAGGPFMLVQVTDYNGNVAVGTSGVSYKGKVTNKGNMDANKVFLVWSLPSGWTVTDGNHRTYDRNLAINAVWDSNIVVSIASSASIGTQTVSLQSGCCLNADKNKSSSVSVVVSGAGGSSTTTTTTTVLSGGVGSVGSGGSSSVFKTLEQKTAFFKSTDVVELVSGGSTSFVVRLSNPLSDTVLEDLSINVFGFMSKYLDWKPKFVKKLDSNEFVALVVFIKAPEYFVKGTYDLNFFITGRAISKDSNLAFAEERIVSLQVHDVSRKSVVDLISDAKKVVSEIKGLGFFPGKVESMLVEAQSALNLRDYESASVILNNIVFFKQKLLDANSQIGFLEGKIQLALASGLNVSESQKLLLLAKLSLERGDVDSALSVLKDVESTFALETKGEFNAFVVLVNNWPIALGFVLLLGVVLVSFSLFRRKTWLESRIRQLNSEENLLLLLIKEEQKKCFVDGVISLQQYKDAVKQHEERLSTVVSDIVLFGTMLKDLFVFRHSDKTFLAERSHLLELIKKLQSDYFESRNIDAVVYDAKQSIFLQRLSEIEEKLALAELRESLRLAGKNGFFWKLWYGVKK